MTLDGLERKRGVFERTRERRAQSVLLNKWITLERGILLERVKSSRLQRKALRNWFERCRWVYVTLEGETHSKKHNQTLLIMGL